MQAMLWASLSSSFQTSSLIGAQEILAKVLRGPASKPLNFSSGVQDHTHCQNSGLQSGFPQPPPALAFPYLMGTQAYSPVIAFSSSNSPPQPVLSHVCLFLYASYTLIMCSASVTGFSSAFSS